jgi:hypothetical protein
MDRIGVETLHLSLPEDDFFAQTMQQLDKLVFTSSTTTPEASRPATPTSQTQKYTTSPIYISERSSGRNTPDWEHAVFLNESFTNPSSSISSDNFSDSDKSVYTNSSTLDLPAIYDPQQVTSPTFQTTLQSARLAKSHKDQTQYASYLLSAVKVLDGNDQIGISLANEAIKILKKLSSQLGNCFAELKANEARKTFVC